MNRALNWIALGLVIVGALNWGLIGLFEFNLVFALFGEIPWLESLVYILVGLAGLYMIYYAAVVEGRREETARPMPHRV